MGWAARVEARVEGVKVEEVKVEEMMVAVWVAAAEEVGMVAAA